MSAQATLRAATPVIELYFVDNGTYAGISYEQLTTNYASELKPLTFASADAASYCVQATAGEETYSQNGPGAPIVAGPCASGGDGDTTKLDGASVDVTSGSE